MDDDEASARKAQRKLIEDMMAAERRSDAQALWGLLAGSWALTYTHCTHCQTELLDTDMAVQVAATERDFRFDDFVPRADFIFDLLNRGRLTIPDWANAETPLWSCYDDPLRIERTSSGTSFGQASRWSERACDLHSFVLVRPCPFCGGADPLQLIALLSEPNLKQITMPENLILDIRRSSGGHPVER